VDVLMTQPEEVYDIPELPFEAKPVPNSLDEIKHSSVDNSSMSNDFLLDREKWTFLNHGAFGAALKVGYDRAEQWRCVFLKLIAKNIYHGSDCE